MLLGGAVALLAGLLTMVVAFVVPRLRNVLGVVPLVPQQWALIGGIALTLLLAVEIGKAINQRFANQAK